MQLVDATLQKLLDAGTRMHATFVDRDEQGLELMAQVAHRRNAGHPGAALERMQVPFEFLHGLPRVLVLDPETEGFVRRFQQFRGLLGEDRGNLLVVIGLQVLCFGNDRLRLALRCVFLRQVRNGSVGLQGIRQPVDMLDERGVVRPFLAGLVDIADDCRYRFRGRLQGVDAGLLETDLVVVDTPYQAIQRTGNCDSPLDVCHVGAAVQRMARPVQLVSNFEWRLPSVACLEIVDDDLEVPGRFFRKNVQQHRIHFESRLFFLHGVRRLFDREHGRTGIAFGERARARHQQTDVAARIGTDLELLDQLRHGGRRLQDEIDHRRRADQRAVDQLVEQVLDGPAIFADPFGADHAATALQGVERTPHGDQRFHVVGRVAPGRQISLDRGHLFLRFLDEEFEKLGIQVLRIGRNNGQRHDLCRLR